jgi:hypothetical protein
VLGEEATRARRKRTGSVPVKLKAEGGLLMLATSFFVCEIHNQRTHAPCCFLAQTGATGSGPYRCFPRAAIIESLKNETHKASSLGSDGNCPRQQAVLRRGNHGAPKKMCVVVVVLAVCCGCLDMAKKFPRA